MCSCANHVFSLTNKYPNTPVNNAAAVSCTIIPLEYGVPKRPVLAAKATELSVAAAIIRVVDVEDVVLVVVVVVVTSLLDVPLTASVKDSLVVFSPCTFL